jgi:hypothetical protein
MVGIKLSTKYHPFLLFPKKNDNSYFGISDSIYEELKKNPIIVHFTNQSKQ